LDLQNRNTLEIHLTATNSDGIKLYSTIPAIPCNTLSNQAPSASFSLKIIGTSEEPRMTIQVDALTSQDPDLDQLTYEWDWGDGYFGSQVITTHTYSNKGSYQIKLTIRDVFKAESVAVKTIEVKGQDDDDEEVVEESTKSELALDKSGQVQALVVLSLFILATFGILVKVKLLPLHVLKFLGIA